MSKPTAPRVSKTPRQRAEESLAVEERRVKRLAEKRDGLRTQYEDVAAEHHQADIRRAFLAQHPDLADPAQMSTGSEGSISMNTEPS